MLALAYDFLIYLMHGAALHRALVNHELCSTRAGRFRLWVPILRRDERGRFGEGRAIPHVGLVPTSVRVIFARARRAFDAA
jgi:hypothetical protein